MKCNMKCDVSNIKREVQETYDHLKIWQRKMIITQRCKPCDYDGMLKAVHKLSMFIFEDECQAHTKKLKTKWCHYK
jgi:hypothetical protein